MLLDVGSNSHKELTYQNIEINFLGQKEQCN